MKHSLERTRYRTRDGLKCILKFQNWSYTHLCDRRIAVTIDPHFRSMRCTEFEYRVSSLTAGPAHVRVCERGRENVRSFDKNFRICLRHTTSVSRARSAPCTPPTTCSSARRSPRMILCGSRNSSPRKRRRYAPGVCVAARDVAVGAAALARGTLTRTC